MEHIYIDLDVYMYDIIKQRILIKKPNENIREFESWEFYILIGRGDIDKDKVFILKRWIGRNE